MPVQKITKDEILLKSSDVFRVKGYHNTSMQDLAEASEDTSLTPEERMEKLLKKMGKLLLEKEGGCLIGNTTLET
eukprot:gene56905-75990_t